MIFIFAYHMLLLRLVIMTNVWYDMSNLDLVDCYGTSVTNNHGYVPLVVSTSRSFPHAWLSNGVVTRLTRRVPLVEQELLTFPKHLSSPPVLVGSCYSIFSCMCMFCRLLSVLLYFFFWPWFCLFFFDIWILITPLVSSNSS